MTLTNAEKQKRWCEKHKDAFEALDGACMALCAAVAVILLAIGH